MIDATTLTILTVLTVSVMLPLVGVIQARRSARAVDTLRFSLDGSPSATSGDRH